MSKFPLKEHIDAHHPEVIRKRLNERREVSYLRDFIYGAIDGTVTTFAVVSGVAGAGLDFSVVIILGVANLIGDGFSMAASNFLGIRAEQQLHDKIRRSEMLHIERYPEGEREEVREIYRQKGFEGEDLERAVEIITSDPQLWVNTMMTDEFGLPLGGPNPHKAAATTFVAFVTVGFLPLFAFVWQWLSPYPLDHPFFWSAAVTSAAFFGVGAAKSWFIKQPWYWEGFQTLLVGGTAAVLAYGVGLILGAAVGV